MIHYQLRCDAAHEFDGWFANSEGFESQAQRGLVACPVCGDTKVTRALMTPGIPRKGEKAPEAAPPAPAPVSPAAGGAIPDAVRTALQRLRQEVEAHCDYVGADFAEEARRIHHGEAERRGIYGESSEEEAASLAEEGIDIARIPWVRRTDS
ncbi:MAG TPA: DUF1178 family protein [Acidocella sp.]|jgi:hypothetical protein|uniref:DUF1178 family protein n=1 Tax=Acidocella sp. TaxID=50710 RepID=UPI002CC3CD0C|nr:DUF1178 family protein [Acidocella sp.]HVE21111.1 DUF1178 family protein [Acidocella sp.]